ncbi:MAG TPA: BadF/BadG/BcrA/BcrD ATPase family protein [Lacisediminihabitans sp.]|uniref:N-acetylglucosamine kinase n=1 Tax=Lacisediminihabitans sp. TaxID=2787631 RepID=UPI002EDA4152
MSADFFSALVVDGGKSKTRIAQVTSAGIEREATLPGLPIIGEPGGPAEMRARLIGAFDRFAQTEPDRVVLALNGVYVPDAVAERTLADTVRAVFPGAEAVISSDMVTSFLGALGPVTGVVLAAGTGTIAMTLDAKGQVHRTDGWGPHSGDRGSGWQIGREGLASVFRTLDGASGGSPLLLELWTRRFGEFSRSWSEIYRTDNPVAMIASFARDVLDAADDADIVAVRIRDEALTDLVDTVEIATRHLDGPAAFSYTGGLLSAGSPFLPRFLAALTERLPSLRVAAPRGDALDGAALLAMSAEPILREVVAWHPPKGNHDPR